jgi:hypothetical protein
MLVLKPGVRPFTPTQPTISCATWKACAMTRLAAPSPFFSPMPQTAAHGLLAARLVCAQS